MGRNEATYRILVLEGPWDADVARGRVRILLAHVDVIRRVRALYEAYLAAGSTPAQFASWLVNEHGCRPLRPLKTVNLSRP